LKYHCPFKREDAFRPVGRIHLGLGKRGLGTASTEARSRAWTRCLSSVEVFHAAPGLRQQENNKKNCRREGFQITTAIQQGIPGKGATLPKMRAFFREKGEEDHPKMKKTPHGKKENLRVREQRGSRDDSSANNSWKKLKVNR